MERHYNLIPIFQKYVLENKIQNKLERKLSSVNVANKPLSNVLSILTETSKKLEISATYENILTPNKTNFKYSEASPFLINITQRKPKNGKIISEIADDRRQRLKKTISVDPYIDNGVVANSCTNTAQPSERPKVSQPVDNSLITEDDDDGEDDVIIIQENLFLLTEENLEKHLQCIPNRGRISLVNTWRNKVNKSRRRESIIPNNEFDLDSFILKNTSEMGMLSISKTSTPISSSSTVICMDKDNTKNIGHIKNRIAETDETESFITAVDEHGVVTLVEVDLVAKVQSVPLVTVKDNQNEKLDETCTNFIRSLNSKKIILQMEEAYMHTDTENNVVFYEQKLLTNTPIQKSKDNDQKSLNGSGSTAESCTETEYTIPLDYDTDDLRQELTAFGEVPGELSTARG